jgi:hypothetical protein
MKRWDLVELDVIRGYTKFEQKIDQEVPYLQQKQWSK